MKEVVLSLALLTLALPTSAALVFWSSRPGTWRRCLRTVGLGVGFLMAYMLLVDSGPHAPGEHPDESKYSALSWSLLFVVIAVTSSVMAGLFGQGMDRLAASAENRATAPTSLLLPRVPAATLLGVFGLATGVLIGSLATGCFCSVVLACYARFAQCGPMFEAPLHFRLGLTLVPVVAHWWIGTRVGSYIDARDELQLRGKSRAGSLTSGA